jgi:putative aldouronate transport system substrate-binding protein
MIYKFIMGTEPLSKFDEYVSTLKRLGAERVTQLYQVALDRYNKR